VWTLSRGAPIDDDPERKLFVPAADLVEMTLDLGMLAPIVAVPGGDRGAGYGP
jgi:hypothetical protein